MRIAVWKTGHEIADTVADAVAAGIPGAEVWHTGFIKSDPFSFIKLLRRYDAHIGYGIKRGMDKVFRECDRQGLPWFNIDRGYFNPNHYDGYYRVSLCGTQQTIGLDKLESDGERFEALGIEIGQCQYYKDYVLVIPPTDLVKEFFRLKDWGLPDSFQCQRGIIWRNKDDKIPLASHLGMCGRVLTFNSSVGWEALRLGIPVGSDEVHSIVGAWRKVIDKPLHLDIESRQKLFAIMGDLQMTLQEIRNGHLCTLLPKLLKLHNPSQSISAGIPVSPSQVKWPRTV